MSAVEIFAVAGIFAVAFVAAMVSGVLTDKARGDEALGGVVFLVTFAVCLGLGFALI